MILAVYDAVYFNTETLKFSNGVTYFNHEGEEEAYEIELGDWFLKQNRHLSQPYIEFTDSTFFIWSET